MPICKHRIERTVSDRKRKCACLRLISSATVEELVLQRAQRKLEIDGKVIQAGKFDDVTTGAEYEELLAKAFEANPEDDNEEANELDDDELNELLAREENEFGDFRSDGPGPTGPKSCTMEI